MPSNVYFVYLMQHSSKRWTMGTSLITAIQYLLFRNHTRLTIPLINTGDNFSISDVVICIFNGKVQISNKEFLSCLICVWLNNWKKPACSVLMRCRFAPSLALFLYSPKGRILLCLASSVPITNIGSPLKKRYFKCHAPFIFLKMSGDDFWSHLTF